MNRPDRPASWSRGRHRLRIVLVTAVVLVLLLAAAVLTLQTGTYRVSTGRVWDPLLGHGSALDREIVVGQRAPRLVGALLVGAALSAAGAVFQTLSRNPLGSPDILGFTTGSATGALVVSLGFQEAGTAQPAGIGVGTGAVLGGFATAAVVLLLARQERGVGGRIVLVGISLGALLSSVNDFLLTRADLEQAESARTWLYGSLNALRWENLLWPGPAVVVLLVVLVLQGRRLSVLELGEDLASGLGVPVRRSTRTLMLLAVGLTAAAMAVSGPLGFLALAAPQLAHRLWGTPGLKIWTSALMGSLVLVAADFAAARLLAPFQIPVGLMTGALGGLYLLWLLGSERSSEGH